MGGQLPLALLQLPRGPRKLGGLLHQLRLLLLQLLFDLPTPLRRVGALLLTLVERPRGGLDLSLMPPQFLRSRVDSR
ncbi:hypothetical protein BH20ACT13_BH20ACT13_15720 [soil metagenome]